MQTIQHNTEEEVIGYLEAALRCVQAAELDGDAALGPIAFSRACDWLAAKTVVTAPPTQIAHPAMAIPRGRGH